MGVRDSIAARMLCSLEIERRVRARCEYPPAQTTEKTMPTSPTPATIKGVQLLMFATLPFVSGPTVTGLPASETCCHRNLTATWQLGHWWPMEVLRNRSRGKT